MNVFEFDAAPEHFKQWAESEGMAVRQLLGEKILSRYKAYIPAAEDADDAPVSPDGRVTPEDFREWQEAISVTLEDGWIARAGERAIAVYDPEQERAYFEELKNR